MLEKELEEYQIKLKEARKKARENYWEFTTKIENNWIKQREKEMAEKKIRDENKLRGSIIRVSYHTHKLFEELREKQKKQDEIETRRRARNDRDYVEKMNYLKTMEIDSRKWPDVDGIKTHLVISPSIYHQ